MLENVYSWLVENYTLNKALLFIVIGLALGGGLRVGKYFGDKGLTYTNALLVALLGYVFIIYTDQGRIGIILWAVSVLIVILRKKRSSD